MKRVPELRVGLARHFLKEWNASPFSETLKLGIYWPRWGFGGRRERNREEKGGGAKVKSRKGTQHFFFAGTEQF